MYNCISWTMGFCLCLSLNCLKHLDAWMMHEKYTLSAWVHWCTRCFILIFCVHNRVVWCGDVRIFATIINHFSLDYLFVAKCHPSRSCPPQRSPSTNRFRITASSLSGEWLGWRKEMTWSDLWLLWSTVVCNCTLILALSTWFTNNDKYHFWFACRLNVDICTICTWTR